MGSSVKKLFYYGTESQILALTPSSSQWIDRSFYYPIDKTYFYQAFNGTMKKYGGGDVSLTGIGILLNGKVLGGIKTKIEETDTLEIPENYDYNTFSLIIAGIINCNGQINIV